MKKRPMIPTGLKDTPELRREWVEKLRQEENAKLDEKDELETRMARASRKGRP